jgi:hypothetical protein
MVPVKRSSAFLTKTGGVVGFASLVKDATQFSVPTSLVKKAILSMAQKRQKVNCLGICQLALIKFMRYTRV